MNSFLSDLAQARHRQLLWLQGSKNWCREQAIKLINQAGWSEGWWLVAQHEELPLVDWGLPKGIRPLPAAASRKELGSEQPCVVVDAFTGFSPDALGALSGVVQAGGLLFLLTPYEWSAQPDSDYQRLAAWPHQPEELSRNFLARCQSLLEQEQLAIWQEGMPSPRWPKVALGGSLRQLDQHPGLGALTQDQQGLIESLLEGWQKARVLPYVVTANRGRGKSSALGLAAAAWLERHPEQKLLVTAPTALACEPLFRQFDQQLAMRGQPAALKKQLCFVAPDALLQQKPQADLLLVDEAAALPVPILMQLLAAWPKSVFATTQQGYEGNGRGFALRFFRHLDQVAPQWQQLKLEEPIRWARQDPLEAVVNRLLLLDTQLAESPLLDEAPHIKWLDRAELSTNEPLLRQVFGLLVLAHYRTTPDDLRQLLDAPGVHLAGVFVRQQPIALAWIQEEGGMDQKLAQAIFYGQRRPQGHLLAQSLAFHGAQPQAVQLKSWRIQRILVHPSLQRRGLGQKLLAWVLAQARQQRAPTLDFIGSSFGATPQLIPFWLQAGFQPARLGITRDQASGEHTLQLLQGLTSAGQVLTNKVSRRFYETLPQQLARPLQSLPADLIVDLFQTSEVAVTWLQAGDEPELDAFAEGNRPWLMSLTALRHWLLERLKRPLTAQQKQEIRLWVVFLLQGGSSQWLIEEAGLLGKKHLAPWLRSSFKRLSAC